MGDGSGSGVGGGPNSGGSERATAPRPPTSPSRPAETGRQVSERGGAEGHEVTIDDQHAARIHDPIDCGSAVLTGSPGVHIGD